MQPISGKMIAAMISPRTLDEIFMMGSLNKVSKRFSNDCAGFIVPAFFSKSKSNCCSKNVQRPYFFACKDIPETEENSVLGIYPINFNRICFELKMKSEVGKNIACLDKQNPI
jgi:hypothetical protein